MLQRHDGHRTIPCFLNRLTGIHSIVLNLQTCVGHRSDHFLHRFTGIGVPYRHMMITGPFLVFSTGSLELGVTDTQWSQDHSLFTLQADWSWCYRYTLVTGPFLFFLSTGGLEINCCYIYRHVLVTGLIVFSTGSLELVYLTDTQWSQDHSLFSPQVDWNWVLQIHFGYRTIPCFSTG